MNVVNKVGIIVTVFTDPMIKNAEQEKDPFDLFKKERAKYPNRRQRVLERAEKIKPFIKREDR